MFRRFEEPDRQDFCQMAHDFHFSDAVIHKTPTEYFLATFDAILGGTPYMDGFILEQDGQRAGYGLLFCTYSNEGDGMLYTWDEIYVRPEFRGRGLGTSYIAFLEDTHRDKASLFRLEVEQENTRAWDLYVSLGYQPLSYRQLCKYCADYVSQEGPVDMVRPMAPADEEIFCQLSTEYYGEVPLIRPAQTDVFKRTFAAVIGNSPYLDGYIIEKGGAPVGYALVCLTCSNEARGMLINLDELYIRPEYRGQGLARGFMRFYERHYKDNSIYRIELLGDDDRHIQKVIDSGYDCLEYYQMVKPAKAAAEGNP